MFRNFRGYAIVLAGFLLLTSLSIVASGANAAQGNSEQEKPAQKQKQEKRVRGREEMADGQIKSVTCKGRAMDMVFDGSYETLRLHSDNYFKVDFSAINFTPRGKMNPCKTAKGMYARVYYYQIKNHPREGDLISVQLRK